jgi:hypothetical protein
MHAFQISEARLDFGERDVITNLLKSRNGTNRGKFEIPTRHIISSINKRFYLLLLLVLTFFSNYVLAKVHTVLLSQVPYT